MRLLRGTSCLVSQARWSAGTVGVSRGLVNTDGPAPPDGSDIQQPSLHLIAPPAHLSLSSRGLVHTTWIALVLLNGDGLARLSALPYTSSSHTTPFYSKKYSILLPFQWHCCTSHPGERISSLASRSICDKHILFLLKHKVPQ